MYWLRTSYLKWAKNQGMELLRDDLRFIEKTLNKIPQNLHKTIMRDFVNEWCDGMGRDAMSLLKQNLGRRKANIWLRVMTEKLKRRN